MVLCASPNVEGENQVSQMRKVLFTLLVTVSSVLWLEANTTKTPVLDSGLVDPATESHRILKDLT